MGARHPLPYGFAKAHTLLLEDDGQQLTLWSGEQSPPAALSEVLRVYEVQRFEREPQASLAQRANRDLPARDPQDSQVRQVPLARPGIPANPARAAAAAAVP